MLAAIGIGAITMSPHVEQSGTGVQFEAPAFRAGSRDIQALELQTQLLSLDDAQSLTFESSAGTWRETWTRSGTVFRVASERSGRDALVVDATAGSVRRELEKLLRRWP